MKIAITSVANFAYGTRAAKWLEHHVPNSKYVAMPNYDSNKPGWEQSKQTRRRIREQQEAKYRIEIYQGEKASARRKRNTWHVVLGHNSLANFQLLKRFVGGTLRLSGEDDDNFFHFSFDTDNTPAKPLQTNTFEEDSDNVFHFSFDTDTSKDEIPRTFVLEEDEDRVDMDVLPDRDEPTLEDIPDDCLCEIVTFLGSPRDYYALRGASRSTARCFAQETSWWCTLNVPFQPRWDFLPTKELGYVRQVKSDGPRGESEDWKIFPNLNTLHLLSANDLSLRSPTRHCKHLQHIDLSNAFSNITDEAMELISNGCTALLELNLTRCELITDSGIQKVLKSCKKLQRLDMSWCKLITDEFLRDLATESPQIRSLSLSECENVSDRGIIAMLVGCKQLVHLNVHRCIFITNEGIVALSSGCHDMRHLDISECHNISNTGIKALAAGCKQLTTLIAHGCPRFTDMGLKALAEGCKQITSLDIKESETITDTGIKAVAGGCKNLNTLNITRCRAISDESLEALSHNCPRLKSLDAYGCVKISDAGIRALTNGCKYLTSIDVGDCDKLTDNGMKSLAKTYKNLRRLGVKWCTKITDIGIKILAANCKELSVIDISKCKITDQGLIALASGCTELIDVNMTSCDNITTVGVDILLITCQQLRELTIYDCKRVSVPVVQELKKSYTKLRVRMDEK